MPSVLILGGASCLHEDVSAARNLGRFDALMAINDAIAVWPDPIDYAVSLHPEHFAAWLKERQRRSLPGRPQLWAHKAGDPGRIDRRPDRTTPDWAGSSGLFAVKVAIEEGFGRIVLAGVPMDARPHFRRGDQPWTDVSVFTDAWLKRLREIAPFTRSISGWTAELLGRPTVEWLASSNRPNGAPSHHRS